MCHMNEKAFQAKYSAIYEGLAATYGEPQWEQERHHPPVDELVLTILSQATSDINSGRGFLGLKERFVNWEEAMNAPVEEVAAAIMPAGLANQKAPRIQQALQTIYDQRGALTLDFLADLPLADALSWLTQLKGVGPKTAAIVMLFAFGRPAFPIDTHVYRILRRTGLISPKVTADKAHAIMQNRAMPATCYPIHRNFIQHGRKMCRARTPLCLECPLSNHCDYYQKQGQSPL